MLLDVGFLEFDVVDVDAIHAVLFDECRNLLLDTTKEIQRKKT